MDRATACIIVIGDELTGGEVVEVNRDHISRELRSRGIEPLFHLVVGDDVERISAAVDFVSSRCDVVIITGGLGPTVDDVTREAVARARGVELVFHPELEESLKSYFHRLGREVADTNLRQAFIPQGAEVIPAARGTAPGFILEEDKPYLYVLPGVPSEMKGMLETAVIPHLEERFSSSPTSITRTVLVFGMGEADVAQALKERTEGDRFSYAFLVDAGVIRVKITAETEDTPEVKEMLEEEVQEVRDSLEPLVFGEEEDTLEGVVGELLRDRGMNIAAAESCTAGMVASRIANVPGSSDYLRGGVVVYTAEMKEKLLGVPRKILEEGAVSVEVAREMAVRVREKFDSSIGVGVTCLAGPSRAGEKKPVGTVCLGIATAQGAKSIEVRLPGQRNFVRTIATNAALHVVRLCLLGELELDSYPNTDS